ncbi:ABC transporter permease [Microbacterium sp. CPCC 204701]|uniref:ABC transporter permease n=1 Tax=Microbacterium sp. CPCC 204701 TaxID=2493084 RepID=UPI001F0BC857|nr:ABC transporter permease [Microbacterium sp. CPCC 204701]
MEDAAAERENRLADAPWREVTPTVGVMRGTWGSARELFANRELLGLLTRREIRAKYKDSVLGMLWSIARPLVQLGMYYLVLGQFLGAARGIPDFAVFIFAGLAIWGLFSEVVGQGTGTMVANAALIKKVHLPREIFPLATVGSALFNFALQFVILLAATLLTGGMNLENLIALPLSILVTLTWALALAFVLSALNVYLRDMTYLVELALMIGFWFSPIVYSFAMVKDVMPELFTQIYLFNPVTLAVFGIQSVMWSKGADEMFPDGLKLALLIALAVGLVVLFICQRVFDRLQRDFAQEL